MCSERVTSLAAVQPLHVAAWVEVQSRALTAPTVKQQAELPISDPEPVRLSPRRAEFSRTGSGYERDERQPIRNVACASWGRGAGS